MPQQPDPATPTRICKVNSGLVGQKVRLAGRMLSYDELTGTIVLMEGKHGVVVDVSLCLDSRSSWARERLAKIIVLGHVEAAEDTPPGANPVRPELEIDAGVVVCAVLVVPAAEMDLRLWNRVVEEGESPPSLRVKSHGLGREMDGPRGSHNGTGAMAMGVCGRREGMDGDRDR